MLFVFVEAVIILSVCLFLSLLGHVLVQLFKLRKSQVKKGVKKQEQHMTGDTVVVSNRAFISDIESDVALNNSTDQHDYQSTLANESTPDDTHSYIVFDLPPEQE